MDGQTDGPMDRRTDIVPYRSRSTRQKVNAGATGTADHVTLLRATGTADHVTLLRSLQNGELLQQKNRSSRAFQNIFLDLLNLSWLPRTVIL